MVRGEVDARPRRGERQEADQILGGHRAHPLLRRFDHRPGVAGEAGLVDDQQDDAAVLLGLVRRDLGVAVGRRGVGRRRRVLDEIDRDDLARLAADLHLEVGRPQAADDDALAIEHGRLDDDDVGLPCGSAASACPAAAAARAASGSGWTASGWAASGWATTGRTGRSRRRRAPRHTSRSVGVAHRSAAR